MAMIVSDWVVPLKHTDKAVSQEPSLLQRNSLEEEKVVASRTAIDLGLANLSLTEFQVFENPVLEIRALVAWSSDTILVCFRGSQAAANFVSDVKFVRRVHPMMVELQKDKSCLFKWWNKPSVHGGFYSALDASGVGQAVGDFVFAKVEAMRARGVQPQVLFAGHSLGGALAQLFAFETAVRCNLSPESVCVYTFGCPGVANESAKRLMQDAVPIVFNVVNNCDFVYHLGSYASNVKHPGIPILINGKGDLVVRPSFVESSFSHFFWQVSLHVFIAWCYVPFLILSNVYSSYNVYLPSCPPPLYLTVSL